MGMGQNVDYSQFVLQIEKAIANGVATLDSNAKVPKNQIDLVASDVGAIAVESDPTVSSFTKGLSSNDAVLTAVNNSSGTISVSRLPSYVDDVLEFATLAGFPGTGETGKIYIAQNTNKTYRWTGSVYVEISSAATADEALKLTTPRTISITGDATYSVSFDGSANVSGGIILANSGVTAGTYNNSATQVRPFTVDAKGRITSVGTAVTITPAWTSIAGKPTTLSGFGITDAQPLGDELTAIQALADTAGFLKKTSNGVYEIDNNNYLPISAQVGKYIATFRKTGTTNPAINLEDGDISIPDYSSFGISPPVSPNTVAVLGSVGANIGGCSLAGFSNNSNEIALILSGYSGKTTATDNAVVVINAAKHSGINNIASLANNDIAFDFRNNNIPIIRIFGNGSITSSSHFSVGSNQVVSSRKTGWIAPTGTASRATFATSTITLSQLAERVKALIDDLTAHGLIGA